MQPKGGLIVKRLFTFLPFYFPIPQKVIDSNTENKIEQNPGWE